MVDLETVNLTKIEGRFRRGLSVVALKFKKNSLDGGTYYRFNLTATNKVNVSASAVIEFKTNSVPTQGLSFLYIYLTYQIRRDGWKKTKNSINLGGFHIMRGRM